MRLRPHDSSRTANPIGARFASGEPLAPSLESLPTRNFTALRRRHQSPPIRRSLRRRPQMARVCCWCGRLAIRPQLRSGRHRRNPRRSIGASRCLQSSRSTVTLSRSIGQRRFTMLLLAIVRRCRADYSRPSASTAYSVMASHSAAGRSASAWHLGPARWIS